MQNNDIVGLIAANHGRTCASNFTIPADKKGYIVGTNFYISSIAEGNSPGKKEIKMNLRIKEFNSVSLPIIFGVVASDTPGINWVDRVVYAPPKSDIIIRIIPLSNYCQCFSEMIILLLPL